MLAAYNDAAPDGGDRILTMAEAQQEHRHTLESTVIQGDTRRANHGLYIGGAIICVALICGTYLVANDKDVQGMFIGVGSIIAALATFIWGWRTKKKEVEKLRERS